MFPEDQEMVNGIEDWTEIIYDGDQGEAERSIFEAEHFHRLLISLGHAAYNMPRLTFMKYSLNHPTHFDFELKVRPQRREAEWSLESNYRPDQRVAEAWRSPLVELDEKLRSENDKLLDTIIKLA